ncbi:MAG: ATP-binding cassette domain-containing protein [Kiritimatiellae bacterium]|nr:ATP-binding cassette domain-containing protein [Kiritimatiellia bacterium]MDD5521859.1 ATP-binding cassette domain-containing protein [Kiritimatiellia bacterium]
MKNGSIIKVQDLRKVYGDTTAVDGISFKVNRGEIFGILGPNGAGKTTTIRMLYGFSPMTSGSLRVFDLDIETDWRAIRTRTGVCHQDNNLDPDLTVRENMHVFARYFAMPQKMAAERTEHLLKFIGLEQRKESKPPELSGGMMRRLILARALLNNPELIILDEPTTGLDPQSRHLVWERIGELKKTGITVLLTTHYMEEAARLCDRLIIIDYGRIITEGNPAELVKRHVGHEVIESSPVSEELCAFVKQRGLEYEVSGDRLLIYCREEDEDLFHEISHQYCRDNCALRTATLEDVFLRLTGRQLRE